MNGRFELLKEMQILMIQRGEHSISAYQSTKIQTDDIIVVSAARKTIESALIKYGDQLHPTIEKQKTIIIMNQMIKISILENK